MLDYVDISAGGETRTNVYFYQANQFAFQKNGMERNPWDSAVQFKDELIRRKFPSRKRIQGNLSVYGGGPSSAKLSMVLERPDLLLDSLQWKSHSACRRSWWLDKAFGKLDLTAGSARWERMS